MFGKGNSASQAPRDQREQYVLGIPLRWVPCNLCGADRFDPIFREHSNIVCCLDCGFVMYNPQPSEHDLAEYYNHEAGYLPSIRKDALERNDADQAALTVAWDAALARLPKPAGVHAPRLVEVGCAYGSFLSRARDWGWDPFGIEVSSETSGFAREVHGLPVETGSVFDSKLPDASADCVVMMQVIEHVSDPLKMLRRVRRFLRTGGFLYVTTPNVESIAARVQGDKWEFKSFPNHLWYFSASSLERALRLAAFRVRELGSHPGESSAGLDENMIRQRLFLPPTEPVDPELLLLVCRKLRCSELWAVAEAC